MDQEEGSSTRTDTDVSNIISSTSQSQSYDEGGEEGGVDLELIAGSDGDSSDELGLDTPLLQTPQSSSSLRPSSSSSEKKEFSILKAIIKIYSDQSGSCQNLTTGLSIVFVAGAIIGILMPKNPALPHPLYRVISSIVGYTYFVSWSVSYYPQVITIAQRKSVEGLSTDASVLGVMNFTSYAIYNAALFWNGVIRKEYKQRHGQDSEITVQSNDVAFALHALLVTLVLLGQIIYYKGFQTYPISHVTKFILLGVGVLCILCILCISFGFHIGPIQIQLQWIDFINLMASTKLILTIFTYLPQLHLNYSRKSTVGWNIWQVVFDFTGGVLSLLQLVWDSIDLDDLYHGIFGNWAKLVLSCITLICDVSSVYASRDIVVQRGSSVNEEYYTLYVNVLYHDKYHY